MTFLLVILYERYSALDPSLWSMAGSLAGPMQGAVSSGSSDLSTHLKLLLAQVRVTDGGHSGAIATHEGRIPLRGVISESLRGDGAQGRNRTTDTRIFKRLLHQTPSIRAAFRGTDQTVLRNVLSIAREARAALAGFWHEEPNQWRIVTSHK